MGQDEVLFEQSEEFCRSQPLVLRGLRKLPCLEGQHSGRQEVQGPSGVCWVIS